jgi:hypothetical protein
VSNGNEQKEFSSQSGLLNQLLMLLVGEKSGLNLEKEKKSDPSSMKPAA